MDPFVFSLALKVSYLVFIIPTVLVVYSAFLSVKKLSGVLAQGLKKIAGGSIIHTTLIMTYLALERGHRGLLPDDAIRLFFMFGGLMGMVLLVYGYLQIYKSGGKLKL